MSTMKTGARWSGPPGATFVYTCSDVHNTYTSPRARPVYSLTILVLAAQHLSGARAPRFCALVGRGTCVDDHQSEHYIVCVMSSCLAIKTGMNNNNNMDKKKTLNITDLHTHIHLQVRVIIIMITLFCCCCCCVRVHCTCLVYNNRTSVVMTAHINRKSRRYLSSYRCTSYTLVLLTSFICLCR